ncbi:type II pantothenate kinase [uncultured Bacteroides sp.]|uniref:type II pantothenate kinase n=1 Tax=uncultured Bacteroides sp. TaxID=162156 RepID=UPI0026280811|nr:type II pantothenate kinase [uncultured Bacteroides sp.]
MAVIIGIDVGGSTTKIAGIMDGEIKSPMFITAADPVTSLFGAFGKYLYDNHIALTDIEQIMLTGVGSAYIKEPLYGCSTAKVDEFISNALGAQYQSGLDRLIVVSMGTGTSFIRIENGVSKHIGGMCIGGGTLQGLSRLLLKSHDIHQVAELAKIGDLSNIDLQIQDICNQPLPDLPLNATASNFGKAESNAVEEDIAAGIVHMVLQTIGSAANLAGLSTGIKDFVLIGNLTQLPQCRLIFESMEELYHIRFHIPPYAEYRTALGAALSYLQNEKSIIQLK